MLTARLIYIFELICIVSMVSHQSQDYGKFDLTVTKFETCQGPKRKNCAIITATVQNRACIDYKIIITQSMVPSKGKVVAKSNGKQLFRLQLDNPCKHLFMKPLFHSLLNTTENCLILKGEYELIIDIEKIAQSYYNGEFIYGSLEFKSLFYNNECNLSCSEVMVTMSPKGNTSM